MTPETIGPFIGAVLLSAATFIYSFLKNKHTNGSVHSINDNLVGLHHENRELWQTIEKLRRDLATCEREKLRLMERLLKSDE